MLSAGDLVILTDTRGRRYLLTLEAGATFHSHAGTLGHDDIIGSEAGCVVSSSGGKTFRVFEPSLREFVLKMKRGAQVIYPKDLAAMLVWGDVFPGARVVEAGIGSGALTLALLRAVGPDGTVTSYELRDDHGAQALANIEQFMGKVPNHTLRIGDVASELDDADVDRIFLDLPEPWRCVDSCERALAAGGTVVLYVPTVPQLHQGIEAFRGAGFEIVEAFEVLHREWNIAGASVRPDHRMVAHTGFIGVARKLTAPSR